MKRSSSLRRTAPLKRGKTRLGANRKRQAENDARAYGPPARRAWVAARPCSVPTCRRTPSQNAHSVTGGMGRKADAETVLPLCPAHHRELHTTGQATFQRTHGLSLAQGAAETQRAWLRHLDTLNAQAA